MPQDEPEEVWPTKTGPPAEAEVAPSSALPAAAPADGLVHGEVTARYRYRAVDGEADNDLLATVLLDVGDVARDPVTAHVFGTTALDIDGTTSGNSPPAFADITDTYDGSLTGWLYEAYVDVHTVEDLETLRIGRQDALETPVLVSFDGVRVESRPLGEEQVQLEVYGGIPAHHFESSSDGDLVFGLAGSARPWKDGRVRLDWMHLEDESLLGSHVDDLLGFELWQRIDQRLLLEGRATMLESEARDMRLRGTYTDVARDLVVEAAWTTLFNPQNDLVQELDPFSATLLTLEPYSQARIQGSKGIGEDWILAAGYDLRKLTDADDEGQFNRDFGRLYTTVTALNTFDRDLTVSLTGELWDATGSEITSWGADVTREWNDSLEGALGAYYSLYKYDFQASRGA